MWTLFLAVVGCFVSGMPGNWQDTSHARKWSDVSTWKSSVSDSSDSPGQKTGQSGNSFWSAVKSWADKPPLWHWSSNGKLNSVQDSLINVGCVTFPVGHSWGRDWNRRHVITVRAKYQDLTRKIKCFPFSVWLTEAAFSAVACWSSFWGLPGINQHSTHKNVKGSRWLVEKRLQMPSGFSSITCDAHKTTLMIAEQFTW